jgi:hypothetical protein
MRTKKMSKDAIDNNLRQVIRDLTRRISALERQQNDVGQLSELSSDMGLQLAGEFRAGNGVEPGDGFSGVRMTADGVSGYDNDVLQSQMSATDGTITAGAGDVILDVTGITLAGNYGSSYISSNSLKWIDGSDTLASIAQASAGVGGTELTLKMTAENLLLDGDVSATKLNFGDTGAITGGSETINDDAAFSFTPVTSRGVLILRSGGAQSTIFGMFTFAAVAGTAYCYSWVVGSATVAATGALSGTTGTDTKVTVSAHTDGKIYIENRSGGQQPFAWQIVAGA